MERQRGDKALTVTPLDRGVRMFLVASLVVNGSLLTLKNLQGSIAPAAGFSLTEAPPMPSPLDFSPVFPQPFLKGSSSCTSVIDSLDGETVHPSLKVFGGVRVSPGEVYWMMLTEKDSRNFWVLDRSGQDRYWWISGEYNSLSVSNYTEKPVKRRVQIKEGKEYRFETFKGGLSSRGTPLIDNSYDNGYVKKSEFIKALPCSHPR